VRRLAWQQDLRLAPAPPRPHDSGIAYLVGAGPGDPGLISVKGLACLHRADLVLYDRLVHPALVEEAPPGAERVYCGKEPGKAAISQRRIEALMVERVRAGQVVVRLKGGDPFVFGRGGEEGSALTAAGLPWEVVPGVTSAVAVPALAGIPLTHRGVAASFTVVAGHRASRGGGGPGGVGGPAGVGDLTAAWEPKGVGAPRGKPGGAAVAPPSWCHRADTLVVLMGVARLPGIAEELLRAGRPHETPVAVVERGSLPDQRVLVTSLGELPELARRSGIRSPAILVVGEVVRLRSQLAPGMELAPRLGLALAEEVVT
jgi:siroheme synthase